MRIFTEKIVFFGLFLACFCGAALAKDVVSRDVEPSGAAMLFRGNTLYLAVSAPRAMLYVFDVSDIRSPRKTAEITMSKFPHALAAEKSSLFAVDTENLYTFDLVNPNSPVLKNKRKIADSPYGPVSVAVENNHIYLANRAGGITRDDAPLRNKYTRTLCVGARGRIYAAGAQWLNTLEDNLEDTLEIQLDSGTPFQLRANGNDLYLALGLHGLTVFRDAALMQTKWDWIDRKILQNSGEFWRIPQNRKETKKTVTAQMIKSSTGPLGKYTVSGTFVYDMAFDAEPAHYVFLAAGESGVITVDASKPDALTVVAACRELNGHKIRGIAGAKHILYVYDAGTFNGKYADAGYGLHVVDASDPLKLKIMNTGILLASGAK